MGFSKKNVKGEKATLESTLTTARTLHVYYGSGHFRSVHVVDENKSTPVYNVDCHHKWLKSYPTLNIRSAFNNTELASISYHGWKARIDAIISGQPVILTTKGFGRVNFSYDSPALSGARVTWTAQKRLDELNMVLLDDKAMPLARFLPAGLSWKKCGRLELLNTAMTSPQLMDEIAITALAIMVYRHVERQNAAVAAG